MSGGSSHVIIGFVAGVVAGISPCILPALPVVLVAGATTPPVAPPSKNGRSLVAGPWWRTRARPLAVVVGLVT